jgi:hypothetical protein
MAEGEGKGLGKVLSTSLKGFVQFTLLFLSPSLPPSLPVFFPTFLPFAVSGFELRAYWLARQALYHLRHSPSSSCFNYLSVRVMFFLGWIWTVILLFMPPT